MTGSDQDHGPTEIAESWRAFYDLRIEVRQRYRSVWRLPLQRRASDVILRHVSEGQSCLDIGGSARFWQGLERRLPRLNCKTLNVDPEAECDYRDMGEVHEKFDLVTMLEVIEHVPLKQGIAMLEQARDALKPGGKLIVTTPNLHHPNRFWDATHVTAYRYDELGAALMGSGFELVELWRLYNAALLTRWFRRTVGVWLHRYLDVDFAASIAAVGVPMLGKDGDRQPSSIPISLGSGE